MRDIWIEELNELAVALAHHKRGKATLLEVQKEMADVSFCIEQMRALLEPDNVGVLMAEIKQNLPKKLNLDEN
jgi:NTP pyrophosphatase (non-canonical NTP hydrolase)